MRLTAPVVAIHTLGCKVNQCDADALVALIVQKGYAVGSFDMLADVYIINTCTVTQTGDKKSLQMIRRARKQNPAALVAVCGCLVQRNAEKIHKAGADVLFDARSPDALFARLDVDAAVATNNFVLGKTKERTRAFIKIQDGCDRFCAYCIVPYVRGPIRSRLASDIIVEADNRIAGGAKEIVLTGIQVASYGNDGNDSLSSLIKSVAALPNLYRLRLSSIDPWAVDDAFLQTVAVSPVLSSHFHLSLQSGCDATLMRMNRRYTTAEYAKVVARLRALRPDMALTTDIIVGFPGESDADFEMSMQFAQEMAFARVHVFVYSPRAGTAAAEFCDQIPDAVKTARGKQLRDLAADLETQFLKKQMGRVVSVLFEQEKSPNTWQGYTDNYTPVVVTGTQLENKLLNVRLIGLTGHILSGEII